jgi:tetratricopeptide (TPR) repeat protein
MQSLRKSILHDKKHHLCLCNNITCKDHNFNEEKFDTPQARIPNNFHSRKKYIDDLLQEYKDKHKINNNLKFLEISNISPYDKTSMPVYSELAAGYLYRKKDYNKSENFCDIILNIIPNHYETLIKKAIIKFNLNEVENAIQIIEKEVLPQQKEHNIAYFWLGYFYENINIKKACELYNVFINQKEADLTSWGYQHALKIVNYHPT